MMMMMMTRRRMIPKSHIHTLLRHHHSLIDLTTALPPLPIPFLITQVPPGFNAFEWPAVFNTFYGDGIDFSKVRPLSLFVAGLKGKERSRVKGSSLFFLLA